MRHLTMLFAGLLMMLSAMAHGALGWPAMRTALDQVGADPSLQGGLSAGWYFGSVSMLGFGAIVVRAALRMRRRARTDVAVVRIVAACYVVYGAAAFMLRDFNPHFLLFIASGLMAGLPTIGPEYRPK